jgi:hypothetical protein
MSPVLDALKSGMFYVRPIINDFLNCRPAILHSRQLHKPVAVTVSCEYPMARD